jgi:hypothetical protein
MINGDMPSAMMGIMGLFCLLLIVLMVLGIAALIKYLRGK